MTLSRRQLARQMIGGFALSAILPERTLIDALAGAVGQLEPPAACGRLMGTVPMRGIGRGPVARRRGTGLGCRLPQDLSTLTADTLLTPNDDHFIRTGCPANIDLDSPWRIRVHAGEEAGPGVGVESIADRATPQGPILMECSGNPLSYGFGLMSVAEWDGVPVIELLDEVMPNWREGGGRVLISGFDDHRGRVGGSVEGASWIFTEDQLRETNAFLATRMNGEPLPRDHGFPVRLMVPGWYGCTCIKWVDAIRIVGEDARATSKMREFASRTHQRGRPRMAREYQPAEMDLCAMPVRIERWAIDGASIEYRVIGIIWGGRQTTKKLMIRFNSNEAWQHVAALDHRSNHTWTLWKHSWKPAQPGRYGIRMKIDDPVTRTRRLDSGFYRRTLDIERV